MKVLRDATFEDVLATYDQESQRGNVRSESLDHGTSVLKGADQNGVGRWKLVILSREEVLNIMLPAHRRCGVDLIPEGGLTVSAAAERVRAITGETGKCWDNIVSSKDREFSRMYIFLQAENGSLKHLDGLHRLLAWAILDKQVELHAYVVTWG